MAGGVAGDTLTVRQGEILEYLKGYIRAHGYAPTLGDIAAEFGYSAPSTVSEHLSNLEHKGYIVREHLPRPMRTCPDCSADITHRYHSAKRCELCALDHTREYDRDYKARRRLHDIEFLRRSRDSNRAAVRRSRLRKRSQSDQE